MAFGIFLLSRCPPRPHRLTYYISLHQRPTNVSSPLTGALTRVPSLAPCLGSEPIRQGTAPVGLGTLPSSPKEAQEALATFGLCPQTRKKKRQLQLLWNWPPARAPAHTLHPGIPGSLPQSGQSWVRRSWQLPQQLSGETRVREEEWLSCDLLLPQTDYLASKSFQ